MNEIIKRLDAMDAKMDRMKDEILQQSARNTQVVIENTVAKQLQLLSEGQQTLLDTLAPKSRVETLEDEIIFLKQVIRGMAQDIAELKKAQ